MAKTAGTRSTQLRTDGVSHQSIAFYATGWRRLLYMIGAAVTFALAAIGAILPGLPTTPFLLLTSYCLLRCSPSLHQRLLRSPVFGTLLSDWQNHRGVRPGVKSKSIVFLLLVVGASLALSSLPALAKLAIAALAMIGVAVVARLPVVSISSAEPQQPTPAFQSQRVA